MDGGPATPQVILFGGRVRTGRHPDEVVGAIALLGERVLAMGDEAEVLALAGPDTQVVDLDGATAVPGFTDVHVHLENAARYDRGLDGATSREDLVGRLERRAAGVAPGAWLICQGSVEDASYWPRRAELDARCGDRPVLVALGGGTTALNTVGLAELMRSPRVDTLWIERDDATGEPTGLVRTKGSNQLQALLPDAPIAGPDQVRWAILRGMEELAAAGITMVHHVVKDTLPIAVYQDLRDEGALPLRVGLLLRGYESAIGIDSVIDVGLRQGFGDHWLSVQGVKISVDGYFPGGGAAFTDPYADDPGTNGTLRATAEVLFPYVLKAHRAGLRCAVHANGDRAVDLAIDAYEAALTAHPRADHRHRIEHVGNLYLTDRQIARMRTLGLVAVPNPPFLHRRARHMLGRLGPDRAARPLRVGSLLRAGVHVVAASDYSGLYPVDPLLGMSAMVTRRALSGETYAPDEAISSWDALRLYTANPAWLSFQERDRGVLAPGMLADIAILSDDPVAIAPDRLAGCSVLTTIVGGRTVHSTSGLAPEPVAVGGA